MEIHLNITKKRVFEIVEKAAPGDIQSKIFDISIMTLIVLNVIVVIFETVDSIYRKYPFPLRTFEIVSVIIFSAEYIVRLWSCTASGKYKHFIKGRIKYVLSPLALIDIFAILPFYLPMILPFDLRFIRAIRLFRLFRIFKMGRYSKALRTLTEVIRNKKEELFISVFAVFVLLIISSSAMYFVENSKQPEAFSSIPAAMWWGVATLTTVGYGDVYPVTPIGKILGAIIALLGIGLFAMPAGILAAGFAEVIKRNETKSVVCTKCGEKIQIQ